MLLPEQEAMCTQPSSRVVNLPCETVPMDAPFARVELSCNGHSSRFDVDQQGEFAHLPNIADFFQLDASSMTLDGFPLSMHQITLSSTNLQDCLKKIHFRDPTKNTKDNPIVAGGHPIVAGSRLLTEYEYLCSALPSASWDLSTSMPSKIYLMEPFSVRKWEFEQPTDNTSSPLVDAIRRHRESANRTKRRYASFGPLYTTISNEAGVESAVVHMIASPLTGIAVARGHQVEWTQLRNNKLEAEAIDKVVQHIAEATVQTSGNTTAVQGAVQGGSGNPAAVANPSGLQQATPIAVAQSSCRRLIRIPAHCNPDPPGPGSGGSFSNRSHTHQRFDLALMSKKSEVVATEANPSSSAAAAAAAVTSMTEPAEPLKPKCYCVGELHGVQVLMTRNGDALTPIDLELTWKQSGSTKQLQAVRSCLSQLYTHMYFQGVCYGFISCYFGTWLANCPSSDPGTMYVSECYPSNSRVKAETATGALALLQHLALNTADKFVLKASDAPDDRFPASGGGGDTNKQDGDHVMTVSQLRHQRMLVPSDGSQDIRQPNPRSFSGSLSRMQRSSATQDGGNQDSKDQNHNCTASSSSPFSSLVLDNKLCLGSAGPVYEGKYQGLSAIMKMLSAKEAMYKQEIYMYRMIQPKQGELVPYMLAAGRLMDGINFIAVERINGVALSSLPSVPKAVGAAALASLRSLATAFPGFIHGDVRLQNVLLVAEGSDTTPRCMWIDFGQSRMNGTRQQQLAEEARLQHLLGM